MKWEDICRRCTLCCHERTVYPDRMEVSLSSPCPFLSTDTGLCRVYDHRFSACPECSKVTFFTAAFGSSLPSSCAYVEWARRHHLRFGRDLELVLVDDISLSD